MHMLAKQFAVMDVQTNGTRGVVIVDKQTDKPLWAAWNIENSGKPDSIAYYYEGNNIMSIFTEHGQPLGMNVFFYGENGVVKAVWQNRGTNADFTERTRYDVPHPRKEIWFDESWHVLEHRTNNGSIQGGIVFNGKWQRVTFTNGAAAIIP
jgi:hypothetical protein